MKRNDCIDIVKGFGIILVVLGHIISKETLKNFIYAFHMPLFFIISGMTLLYSIKKYKNIKKFLISKFKTIMIPYFFFSIISFIYWFFLERYARNQNEINPIIVFKNIFLMKVYELGYSFNVVMWFLPCLFVSIIISFILIKQKNNFLKFFCLFSIIFLGIVLNNFGIVLPLSIETSLIAIPFVILGYYINYFNVIENKKYKCIFNLLPIIFIIVNLFNETNEINMLNHKYGNFLLFYFNAISISLLLFKVFKDCNCKLLSLIGNNSLIIMCLHEPIKRIVIKIMAKIIGVDTLLIRYNLLLSFIALIVIILIILPIAKVINNHFKFVIGKTKLKESKL